MKTPKEKAKELFDKMYFVNDIMGGYPMCYETAKQCALIAVDEIISYINRMNKVLPQHLSLEGWQEVKQEIENYDNSAN